MMGIFWKVLSCGCFAAVNILVRYLSGGGGFIEHKLPVLVIIFYQNIIGVGLLLPFVIHAKSNSSNRLYGLYKSVLLPQNLCLRWVRIVVAVVGIVLWYISLSKMQVTQVVAISFLSPIITIIGAAMFLQEKITFNRLMAILLSILGGFLISRPDLAMRDNFNNWYAVFPLAAALIFAVDKVIVRKILNNQECPKLTTLYLLLFSALICLGYAVVTGAWAVPCYTNILPLLLLSIFGAVAQFALHKSLELSEITVVIPYGISKMVFSAIFSYAFFAEAPNTVGVWVGIIVMTLSTLILV
jgi:drug/metabolite transporter (DMT)-like permease